MGGNDFSDADAEVVYRSLRVEGRISPVWVQRFQSERATLIEAELSKDQRTTKEERAARDVSRTSDFGASPGKPIGIEEELRTVMPSKVAAAYGAIRVALGRMKEAKTLEGWQELAGEVDTRFAQAVREAPWFPLTYYYRAEWEHYLGESTRALADLSEAVAQQGGFVEARLARAELLLARSRYGDAGKDLDAALDAAPDLARARLLRALLNYYAGRNADAVLELETARRLDPGNLVLRRATKRLRNIVTGPRWSETVTLETPGYTIKAEVSKLPKKGKKEDAAKAVRERTQEYADHLDAARRWFAEFVPGAATAAPRKPLIYIFESPESYYVYADFTQEDRLAHTAGVYFPAYQQLLFFRDESEKETLVTMTHEAFHEYIHGVIPGMPVWANEGMAEYAAGITVRNGRVADTGRLIRPRLRDIQMALRGGWDGIPFERFMAESVERFYSISPELKYAQAWSMIHFFMHAQEGRYKPALDLYLLALSKGKPQDEAFRGSFGRMDLSLMRREWAEYVRALK